MTRGLSATKKYRYISPLSDLDRGLKARMDTANQAGCQRLSLERLQRWEALGLGLFIHFGMSTFDQTEHSQGNKPSSFYAPDRLDVDQWVSVARDAGATYAVLTAKHVAGHALWPSRHTDYHVGTSGNSTDVVAAFVDACRRRGVIPGLYYCTNDNHHSSKGLITRAYEDFQFAQLEELARDYGPIGEFWLDLPHGNSWGVRHAAYQLLAGLQPDAVIIQNNGINDGSVKILPGCPCWPTDVITIETMLPPSSAVEGTGYGHQAWRELPGWAIWQGGRYYLPGEVCDTVCKRWFWTENDAPKSDRELLGVALLAQARGCNLLLDVGPDRHGLIPSDQVEALGRLRRNLDRVG